jgi:hypothetical protein
MEKNCGGPEDERSALIAILINSIPEKKTKKKLHGFSVNT